ncbi:MAG: gamma carbonic anhydrase family protein [Dehalococcoidales bacterium]
MTNWKTYTRSTFCHAISKQWPDTTPTARWKKNEATMIRSFNGKTPRVASSAFISEAAYVVGDVVIGENVSVWPGAVIRGDSGSISIGAKSIIEDGCIIHSGSPTTPGLLADVTIGENVQIGHGAVLNCISIGSNTLIGMNATILHDVRIGNYCVIAAGAVVNQGMKIPDRSFVAGVPARIKGEVTEDQLWWVSEGSAFYRKLTQQYREEGL